MSALEQLIDPSAERLQLGRGYEFTEGPAWSVGEQALIFSDIPADRRYRWTSDSPEVYVAPNHKGNGMVYESGGTYLVCESDTSLVSRFTPDGQRKVVVSHFEGGELNSPNDIVTRSDDSIYFTDPNYGRWNDRIGMARAPELDFQGVFRCERDGGHLQLLVARDEFEQPNGLCFSPDESVLYVNDSPRCHIKAFDVAADGTIGPSRLFFEGLGTGEVGASTPDGMKCDERRQRLGQRAAGDLGDRSRWPPPGDGPRRRVPRQPGVGWTRSEDPVRVLVDHRVRRSNGGRLGATSLSQNKLTPGGQPR